jgi:hypothetical protein
MPDRLICSVEQLNFYAIETASGAFPALEFISALDPPQRLHFDVAARVLATSLAAGRPPAGRASRVAGTSCGLFELRITPAGSRGGHLRLLYVREGDSIRCALGVLKREKLKRRDIQRAEEIVRRARDG